jgi:transposase
MESESCIQLSAEDRARLEGWVAGRNTPQKLVWRARIVLMWAQGAGVAAIVRATRKTKRTVYRWRDRYIARGAAGLERDATRPGRKPPLKAATIERVVTMTLNEKPPKGTAIEAYLEHHNADPKPFVWTAQAADILEKVARGRQALESVH